MDILAIGNSFSQDAARYLHGIARSASCPVNIASLVIGGCPLSAHYENIKNDSWDYALEFNGHITGFPMSIKTALLNREWDAVVIQQVSIQSISYDTYQPYLNFCVDYIRELCPSAKVYLQHTWSYENNGAPLLEWTSYKTSREMFKDVHLCYEKALIDSGADGLIPSGPVMLELSEAGYKMYRDGFHASLGIGRYAIALTWFSYLTGRSADDATFCDFDEAVSESEIAAAKNAVNKILCK